MSTKKLTYLQAIKNHCLECMGKNKHLGLD